MDYTLLLEYAEDANVGDQPFDVVVSMYVDAIRESQIESVIDSLFEVFDQDDDIDNINLKEIVQKRKQLRKERKERKDRIARRVRFEDEISQ